MNLLKTIASVVTATAVLALSTVGAMAQSTWDAIQERGTLRIGVTQAPPWFTKDISSGEWTGGLGVTLGQKMAEALEVELETVEVTWGTSIAALQSDKIDLMYFLSPTRADNRLHNQSRWLHFASGFGRRWCGRVHLGGSELGRYKLFCSAGHFDGPVPDPHGSGRRHSAFS
jgi:hypothetical protein